MLPVPNPAHHRLLPAESGLLLATLIATRWWSWLWPGQVQAGVWELFPACIPLIEQSLSLLSVVVKCFLRRHLLVKERVLHIQPHLDELGMDTRHGHSNVGGQVLFDHRPVGIASTHLRVLVA